MRMRWRIVALASLLACSASAAAAPTTVRLSVTVNWYFGLRVGVEVRPWERVGFAADVGTTAFSLGGEFVLTYDAFVMLYAFDRGSDLQVNACIGIPDATVIFSDPVATSVADDRLAVAVSSRWNCDS